ncbi:MAG: lactonase family protein [Pirellulaceae bacterium]
MAGLLQPQSGEAAGPLIAYVGTYSSPLRDVLPTQVDLPPGNGRGIHLFQVDRATGAMTPIGILELGTSPSCLALNAAGTRLYCANETDRVGDDKEGTVSALAINRADGKLELLNTVRSGGAGPTYVSVHPCGRFLLVANYFGGSVAVLPIVADGRLEDATDIKNDTGKIGPTRATNAPPGSFAFSGHDRTHAHMIQADPSGRFVYAGNRLHDSIGVFSVGPDGDLTFIGEAWTRGNYPRSFNFDPTGQFLYCCNQRGDNIAVFHVDRKTGGLNFSGHYTPVGNPSVIVFLDLTKAG